MERFCTAPSIGTTDFKTTCSTYSLCTEGDSKRVLVMVLNWASCEGGIRVTASIHHQKRFMHAKLVMAWLHIFVCDNFKCIIPCQLHSSYLLPTSSHRIVSVTGAANIDVQQHKLSMRYSPWFTVHKSH